MHTLSLPRRVELGPKDIIEPGEWVLDDTNAAQLLVRANGGTMMPLGNVPGLYRDQDYNGKKILIMRAGGFGDLMLLAPVLREIKRRWPTCTLCVSTMGLYAPVLQGLEYVDEVVSYPVAVSFVEGCAACVFYEKTIEENPRAQEIHMTDVFAEVAGLDSVADKKPDYRLTARERAWASICYPRTPNTPRIGVQYGASAYARTFPPALTQQVLDPLYQKGWEIFFFGRKGEVQLQGQAERLKNLADADLTFRQSVAVLNTCDVVLAPDSAMVHASAALDVPCVALYGPFPWKLRTAYSPSVLALQGNGACSPCFHHAYLNNHFPKHGPCAKEHVCVVLAGIPVARITSKLEQHARQQPAEEPTQMDGVIPFKP